MRTSITRKLAAAGVAVAGAVGLSAGLATPSSALKLPNTASSVLGIANAALAGQNVNFPPGVNGGVPSLPQLLGNHFSQNPNPQATQLLSQIQNSAVGDILGQVQNQANCTLGNGALALGLQIVSNQPPVCTHGSQGTV